MAKNRENKTAGVTAHQETHAGTQTPEAGKVGLIPTAPTSAPQTGTTQEPPQDAQDAAAAVGTWVTRINAQTKRSAEGLIELGRLLLEAKAALAHGEWEAMFKDGGLQLDLRFALRLMQVAKNGALTKTTNLSSLPPSLDALTKLSRLPAETIEEGIEKGTISPAMTARRAKEFVEEHREPNADPPAKSPARFQYDAALSYLVRPMVARLRHMPDEWRERLLSDLIRDLKRVLDEVRSGEKPGAVLAPEGEQGVDQAA
jgi:hypothetical protein